jgi:hypothetical protein
MRKIFAILAPVTAALAAAVALALPGAAFASSCSASTQWALLNQNGTGMAVGDIWHESIVPHTYTYRAGSFRDNMDIIVGNSSFQVGVIRDSTGALSTYIERDGVFKKRSNANVGTSYAMSISRPDANTLVFDDGNGNIWSASYPGGGNLIDTGAHNGGQNGGTCNAFSFTNGGPESPYNLNLWSEAYNGFNSPYVITNRTSSSFNVGGS